MRRFNNRADCSIERASFDAARPLPCDPETEVWRDTSLHLPAGSARHCPAASTHSTGSSKQITILPQSIDALTQGALKRSIQPITKRPPIWNTPLT
jgi:hypothetical protein